MGQPCCKPLSPSALNCHGDRHPRCLHLQRAGVDSRSPEEVAAVEDCCIEWHRLLPVLLPAGNPDARLAPGAFFRPCAAPASGGLGAGSDAATAGATSAAAILLSFISYPYFGSSERALVMRSMHCLAAAAATAAPGAVFAVLLPQESPEAGVASAARGAIAAAFSPAAAAATPQLVAAACDALVAAVQYHPSLLDALLFPCGLEQALLDKVGNLNGWRVFHMLRQLLLLVAVSRELLQVCCRRVSMKSGADTLHCLPCVFRRRTRAATRPAAMWRRLEGATSPPRLPPRRAAAWMHFGTCCR